ncbi:N-terminal acetyltransferase A, auxiliary subunit [Guyanagaster necrorhizus]|uniref:N-terminal acetyltransferase A, auxiliary subunit n=1 Tax=Guyanagaster necrorhizus TaxID=856835 RepID=A0A9P7VUA1_9AGAR|nr:N-terminal acetyltransferase A, auxiliary subunit [Guyanagaster necrorhizus MCA 3950]KAG7446845.1 N-terminal acetyltransferase A, auxiliary subunit [Guyanagaster necrorhizus MCA 3950]
MSRVLGIPPKRALPLKEASLFKEVLTMYEARQLKKGLKTADQILKKFPEHGETMCMKGLILTHMGRREEGIDLVKKGVRLDLTSHICWHVFGLIQKGEKNYEEALKSYIQALRFDKENLNILRDAAHLQTQLRLYDGLVETRHILLRLRPTVRQNWVSLAVAYHLSGNLLEAKKVLEQYERTLKNVPDYDTEHSETTMYHVRLLEELGEFTEALSLLDVSSKSRVIVDKTAIMEARARLLSKLKSDESEHAWRVLIDHNPDCTSYYHGYLASQGIDSDEASLAILRDISSQIPRANAPRRLALSFASGDRFKELAKPYLLSGFTKGIPSLFADIKLLYKDQAKLSQIQALLEEIRAENAPDSAAPSSSTFTSQPTTYLWILYFQAQHFSYLSQFRRALEILDEALKHTPTLPELYTCRARVLKRAGDLFGAARSVEEARLLDGQDRFLNTKSAKYRLRAGLVDEASALLGLFTKKDATSPGADLEDMQSLLYLIEEADAQNRSGKINLALKKYIAIQKVFDEVEDDQYDFHGYSMRKFTINIYLNLLAWEDRLRSHLAYVKAAISASRIFVAVHDDPSIAASLASSGQLTDAEKKAKKKAKKAAQKVQDDSKKGNSQQSSNEDKGLEPTAPKDDDVDGIKLLGCSDPLERAAKFLHPLTTLAPQNIEVWIAVYDVAIRRKKLLQAAKALKHACSIDVENPELHIRLVHVRRTASALPQEPPVPIGPLFKESLLELLPEEVSLETFNSQYLQRHPSSQQAILAAAKVSQMLQAPLQEVENTLFAALGPDAKLDLESSQAILSYLKSLGSQRAEEFRLTCDGKFDLSTVFKSPEEQALLVKQALSVVIGYPDEVEAEA